MFVRVWVVMREWILSPWPSSHSGLSMVLDPKFKFEHRSNRCEMADRKFEHGGVAMGR